MPQLLDIRVWRKEGAQFASYQGAKIYVYEVGTTTEVLLQQEDGTFVAQPVTVTTFGSVTATGAAESGTERVYLTSGSQQSDIRILDVANGIDQTFEDRAIGVGTLTVAVDSSGIGQVAGSQTYLSMQAELAQYVGGPGSTRFRDLAKIAIKGSTDFLNNYDFVALSTAANITLQTSTRRYSLPNLFKTEIAGMILSADGLSAQSPCAWVPYEEFFRFGLEKSTNGGIPSYFTYDPQGGEIVVDTSPGAAANGLILRIAYYRRIPSMSADGDTLGVDTRIEQAVKEHAIWRIRRLNRDPWQDDEKHALAQLRTTLAAQPSVDYLALGL